MRTVNIQYNHIMPDWKYEIFVYFSLKNGSLSLFEYTRRTHLKYDDDLQFLRNCFVEKNHNDDDDEIIFQNDHWIEVNYVKFIPKHDQCCSFSTEVELWKRKKRPMNHVPFFLT